MINSVVLMGRLTYEPELKTTTSGLSVIRFQMAVDRNYQSQGQERQADFIDVVAWRQTADFVSRYFHKGSMIAVEGSIQTNNFTDRDGNKRNGRSQKEHLKRARAVHGWKLMIRSMRPARFPHLSCKN